VLHSRGAEVARSLAARLAATQQQGALARRCLEGQLVEGEALTAGLDDAGAGGGGEAERADGQLRHLKETHVVGDGADDNCNLVLRRCKNGGAVSEPPPGTNSAALARAASQEPRAESL